MRKAIFVVIAILLTIPAATQAQQGQDIVKKAYRKMMMRKAVEWNTTWKWKPLSEDDTTVCTGTVQYAKLPNGRFILHTVNDAWQNEQILVPDSLLWINKKDSTAWLYLQENWEGYDFPVSFNNSLAADVMTNLVYQYSFKRDNSHHFALAMYAYSGAEGEYTEVFKENDHEYDIQLNGEYDTLRMIIRKSDLMITYGQRYLFYEGESQSDSYTFEDVSLNPEIPTIQQRIEELPDYYTVDLRFPKEPDSLDLGSPVQWTGRYFEGDTVSSEDFKGKWALYKFTYRSCGWCDKAVPMTNKIIERFPDLVVAGLDPIDHEKPEKLRQHIELRELEYPIILIPRHYAKELKVDGYPKFYLVNPDGKLVWFQDGYPRDHEDEVIEEIAKVLENS